MRGLASIFADVEDPRAANARHSLSNVLVIGFAAVLCGAESCVDMADFGRAKEPLLRTLLELPHGTPSHDTFSRVLNLLDPPSFEACFRRFMTGFAAALSQEAKAGSIIALDGKSLRGAVAAGSRSTPLHLVTAWCTQHGLVLSLRRAPKRSEVTAAREIIALLDLTDCTITADALHGSRETAQAIRERQGDYVLAIKGNRGPLHRCMQGLMAQLEPASAASSAETGHGRVEERRAWVVPAPDGWAQDYKFKDLTAVARIDSLRRCNGQEERQSRYFALSKQLSPKDLLATVRAHWTIENSQHWVLDVAFNEDRIHTRNDNAAENIALLRRLALNLLKSNSLKASIRRKIKRAGWVDAYLIELIAQMR
jgi:predicted transposase YbfD/YdcC